MSHICAALLLLGAGLALRGGPRNDAICTNDRALAFAYDCRHGAWHVATAALVWVSVAIFRGKPRSRPIAFAAAAALPALTRLVDQFGVHYEAWLVATVWSVVALVAVAFVLPMSIYKEANENSAYVNLASSPKLVVYRLKLPLLQL